jgi:hypothetical protein
MARSGGVPDSTYAVVVNHGSTATTARPSGAGLVIWVGSVSPNNAAASDLWEDTATPAWKRYTGSAWVSLGGSSTPTTPAFVRAATNGALSTTTLTFTFGSAPTAGHLLVACLNVSQFQAARDVTPPAGWVLVDDVLSLSSSNDRVLVYSKKAGGSEGTSYVFNISGSAQAHSGVVVEFDSGTVVGLAEKAQTGIQAPFAFDAVGSRIGLAMWIADNANDGASTLSAGWTKAGEVNGGTAHGTVVAYTSTPTTQGSGVTAKVTTTMNTAASLTLLLG